MQDRSRIKCDRPVARVDRRTVVVRVRSVTRRTGEDTAEGGAARHRERKRGTQGNRRRHEKDQAAVPGRGVERVRASG